MSESFEERAHGNLVRRNEEKIRENAERIQEHIGYVLQRIAAGHVASTGLYARDIAASAQEIVTRVAALEAVEELKGIYDSAAESHNPTGSNQ
jgi:hypothetical protein